MISTQWCEGYFIQAPKNILYKTHSIPHQKNCLTKFGETDIRKWNIYAMV